MIRPQPGLAQISTGRARHLFYTCFKNPKRLSLSLFSMLRKGKLPTGRYARIFHVAELPPPPQSLKWPPSPVCVLCRSLSENLIVGVLYDSPKIAPGGTAWSYYLCIWCFSDASAPLRVEERFLSLTAKAEPLQ
jgi:hypothetical protein